MSLEVLTSLAFLVPFVGIAVGLLYRTFAPYFIVAFQDMKESGEWPTFQKKFWIPPLATLAIETIALTSAVLAAPSFMAEVTKLSFWAAVAFAVTGQTIVRDGQKLYEATRKKPSD